VTDAEIRTVVEYLLEGFSQVELRKISIGDGRIDIRLDRVREGRVIHFDERVLRGLGGSWISPQDILRDEIINAANSLSPAAALEHLGLRKARSGSDPQFDEVVTGLRNLALLIGKETLEVAWDAAMEKTPNHEGLIPLKYRRFNGPY